MARDSAACPLTLGCSCLFCTVDSRAAMAVRPCIRCSAYAAAARFNALLPRFNVRITERRVRGSSLSQIFFAASYTSMEDRPLSRSTRLLALVLLGLPLGMRSPCCHFIGDCSTQTPD